MDQGGEQDGEGDMNGESSMDACTPTFVNRQPVRICCYDSGNSNWGSVNNLERWGWMGCLREIPE